MGERDAQLHATFSPKFSSFPRSHNATIFFSGRNINSLSLCSPRFCPPCAKSCKDVANGSFPPPFYQLHAQRASRNLFPLRGKRKVVEKKRKGDPPNRGILDQRLAPEGNHIFRTETTISPFFQPSSSCRRRCRLLSPFRGISQSLGSSGKSSRTYRRVFPVIFLRHVLAMVAAIVVGFLLGIDNARDAAGIRPSIIVEDKSVWRRVSRQWCEWAAKGPFAMEKNACGDSERTETIIYKVWRTIGSSEGRAKNGIKWILAGDNR